MERRYHTWLFVPVALALAGCSEYDLKGERAAIAVPEECKPLDPGPAEVAERECSNFEISGFEPIVEWEGAPGMHSRATVAVGDLDADGMPEVVGNFGPAALFSKGVLVALEGDTGAEKWRNTTAGLAFASSPAIGDIDGDGHPEIIGIRALGSQFNLNQGLYAVVAFDWQGNEIWATDGYNHNDFDYATGPILSDMDHDGNVEVIAGRVILNNDGTERGKGVYGRGSYGIAFGISEATVPAVADLDLDGTEELITGDTVYGPDGEVLWHDDRQDDGMIGVANLDGDPEGEFVAATWNTVRAVDHNGQILWGPLELLNANIVSPPAIGDLDGDASPEIVVAGGNEIRVLHADGSTAWSADVTDETGASGASIFDFDNDGTPEVVYIDEIEMIAYDGATGQVKFHSTDHSSDTMMDYPVIADVDADGAAEIVVAEVLNGRAISVYGDLGGSWAPARKVWNQHAYSITNIYDDLQVPTLADPGFATHNTWHAASNTLNPDADGNTEMTAEILDICQATCAQSGTALITARIRNHGTVELPPGIGLSLYALTADGTELVGTRETIESTPPLTTGEVMIFIVPADLAPKTDSLRLIVDEDNAIEECDETNNVSSALGGLCLGDDADK